MRLDIIQSDVFSNNNNNNNTFLYFSNWVYVTMYILFYLFHAIDSNSASKHLRLGMRLNFLHFTLSLWMSGISYLMSSSSSFW